MERERRKRAVPLGPELFLPIDPGAVADPRFLADTRLLAALHADLLQRHGEAAAGRALLQTGFVNGLRDALQMRRDAAAPDGRSRGAGPLVTMRLASVGPGGGLRGSWPEQIEAEAVVIARGRPHAPACLVSAGYTSGWISGLWDADVLVVERRCAARGEELCEFEARDAASWQPDADPAVRAALEALPFGALRSTASRDLEAPEPAEPGGAFDPASPAVHVWGPVMVVPYAGDETAVAVEAVALEPSAAGVTVVVVDLQGAIVDDGFGAVALERVVDAIHAHGAEAVLTGVAPLSERVVDGLGRGPLLVRKDLRDAIAIAFQIAESQRHAV
jgi:anti-anti-sigma regulatory factor